MGQQSWFIGSLLTPYIFVYSFFCSAAGGGPPQSLPKPPQSLPKPAKASPKHSQSLPKPPQSLPKASQSLPKASPDYPKLSKRLPRRLQSRNTHNCYIPHDYQANFRTKPPCVSGGLIQLEKTQHLRLQSRKLAKRRKKRQNSVPTLEGKNAPCSTVIQKQV